jgi:hypothetical protein
MDNHRDAAADMLVILGITGDDINTEQLVKHAREAIVDSGLDVDDTVFDHPRWQRPWLPEEG